MQLKREQRSKVQGWGLELESRGVGVCVDLCVGESGAEESGGVCGNPLGSVGEKKLGLGRW